MKQRRRKGIKGLILALATAAILVPAASGKIYEGGSAGYVQVGSSTAHARPDDRAGIRSVGNVTTPDLVDRQLANLEAKAAQVAQAIHVDDRAGIRGPGPVETPALITRYDGGFDWTDAGIGASVAFLTAAMLVAATRMRRREGLAV
jgi:hypothetical protein